MGPKFPLYIPSKGRAQYMITSKALTIMGVHHHIVVEPQELEEYKKAVDRFKLNTTVVELDMKFKEAYDTCDEFGTTRSTGSGPARNFIWEHSISMGHEWHWIMDDNIKCFRRLNKNEKVKVSSGKFFSAMEDFVLRYTNVSMAGPNYCMFAPARTKQPPFATNTRIYSCNLIKNDSPYRWRGRYNEDTILSLDMLKSGRCTILFNAFLQEKMPTQTLKGGNTDELYAGDGENIKGSHYKASGTTEKSEMLVREHPDVAKVKFRFGRVHHHVDYLPFKTNKLIRKESLDAYQGENNYGMKLVKFKTKKADIGTNRTVLK